MIRWLVAAGLIASAVAASRWAWGSARAVSRAAWLAFRFLRARRRMGELPLGEVSLRGALVGIDLLDSPVTSTRSVCYLSYLVERWDETPDAIGIGGRWVYSARDEQAAPFELSDGVHSVLVDPRRAEVLAPSRLRPAERAGWRVSEAVLRPGDEILVVGMSRDEGGFAPSSTYRGHNVRRVIGAGQRGLTIARCDGLLARLGAGAVGNLVPVAFAVALSVGSALYAISLIR